MCGAFTRPPTFTPSELTQGVVQWPRMEAEERARLLAELESGRKALLDVLSGVTEEVAARRPAPERWSVIECVEHLAIAEDYLFSQIAASCCSDAPTLSMPSRNREALILSRGVDRTRPVQSPEGGRPTGRFATLREAVQYFLASRERTVRFVENCREDLRSKLTSHPIIGTVNCYENLLMMAVHPLRHSKQIEEIKTALG
jgi:hypothetical protein